MTFMRLLPVMANVRTTIDIVKVARKFFVIYQLRINMIRSVGKKNHNNIARVLP